MSSESLGNLWYIVNMNMAVAIVISTCTKDSKKKKAFISGLLKYVYIEN